METLSKWFSPLLSLVLVVGGFLFTSGKLKGKIDNHISVEDFQKKCKANQDNCGTGVGKKFDELKKLVIDLHNSQSAKIESMDTKREAAKDEYKNDLNPLYKSIGRIEGFIESIKKGESNG